MLIHSRNDIHQGVYKPLQALVTVYKIDTRASLKIFILRPMIYITHKGIEILLLVVECLPVCVKSFNTSLYLVSSIVVAIDEVFTGLKKKYQT